MYVIMNLETVTFKDKSFAETYLAFKISNKHSKRVNFVYLFLLISRKVKVILKTALFPYKTYQMLRRF